MQHVFIIGSKGIPGAYGGYETFVDKLTEGHEGHDSLTYHVACKDTQNGECYYHGARCFHLKVPNIGPAQAIYYDVKAFGACCRYIKENKISNPIVYVLACRMGPFFRHYVRKLHRLGGKVYVNPDGHEWMRAKWSRPVRAYWKWSEKLMVKRSDLLICDSLNIEKYIQTTYAKYSPATTFIAYGAETTPSLLSDEDGTWQAWMQEKGLRPREYYLVVGRFVPENNYETMLREFMASDTKKDFALITNVSQDFLEELKASTGFDKDPRIKFVGTVYQPQLLKKIRQEAYGYFHGHEVGGTNPSLLEALGSTRLNLLLDVGFNREVGQDAALYFTKEAGNLAALIHQADGLEEEKLEALGAAAKERIRTAYSWEFICQRYENVFLSR